MQNVEFYHLAVDISEQICGFWYIIYPNVHWDSENIYVRAGKSLDVRL